MTRKKGFVSSSGVRISDDFRENLIIDRYHPSFVGMRQSKIKHLKSENSEDAISWNVFRSLGQIDPAKWVPSIFKQAFGFEAPNELKNTFVELWKNVVPPPALLETGDEGISEIDIIIENPHWVMVIEAKYKSDISTGTTTRPERDQILRNIDVGSYYAGVRDFYFALLMLDESKSPKGVAAVNRYKSERVISEALPHRKDDLSNIRGIGVLTWSGMALVLEESNKNDPRVDELFYAKRAVEWLSTKGVNPK